MSTLIEEPIPKIKDPELAVVLYRIIGLSKKWQEDKEVLASEQKEFSSLIRKLNKRLDEIQGLEDNVKNYLQDKIKAIAVSFNQQIRETVREEINAHFRSIDHAFTAVAKDFKNTVETRDRYILGDLKITCVTVLCFVLTGVLSGIITASFLIPTPHVNISDQQMAYFKKGEALEEMWPKLSKAEKERLQKLLRNS